MMILKIGDNVTISATVISVNGNYKDVIEFYGKEAQARLAMEECAELIQAINKRLRYPDNDMTLDGLYEEIADVEIMLQQLKMICDVKCSELEGVKYQKTERLAERLNGEKTENEDQRYIHINIYDDNLSIEGHKTKPEAIIRAIDGLVNVLIGMK